MDGLVAALADVRWMHFLVADATATAQAMRTPRMAALCTDSASAMQQRAFATASAAPKWIARLLALVERYLFHRSGIWNVV